MSNHQAMHQQVQEEEEDYQQCRAAVGQERTSPGSWAVVKVRAPVLRACLVEEVVEGANVPDTEEEEEGEEGRSILLVVVVESAVEPLGGGNLAAIPLVLGSLVAVAAACYCCCCY